MGFNPSLRKSSKTSTLHTQKQSDLKINDLLKFYDNVNMKTKTLPENFNLDNFELLEKIFTTRKEGGGGGRREEVRKEEGGVRRKDEAGGKRKEDAEVKKEEGVRREEEGRREERGGKREEGRRRQETGGGKEEAGGRREEGLRREFGGRKEEGVRKELGGRKEEGVRRELLVRKEEGGSKKEVVRREEGGLRKDEGGRRELRTLGEGMRTVKTSGNLYPVKKIEEDRLSKPFPESREKDRYILFLSLKTTLITGPSALFPTNSISPLVSSNSLRLETILTS